MRPSTSALRSALPSSSAVRPTIQPFQALASRAQSSAAPASEPSASSSSNSGSSSTSSSSSSSCSSSYTYGRPSAKALKAGIPPIRAHILSEPLPYPVGLKLQGDIIDARLRRREKKEGGQQDVLLLLEHTPTYTTGRRDNSPNPNELHPEEKKVQNVGADFFITMRGGQVTYHGPGQLVGYPILDLNAMDLSTRCYVEYMQRLLGTYCSTTLGLPDIAAPHKDGHVGVFAGDAEKVASIGIHLRHRITSHGFAINITPEPINWFDLVVACGLTEMRAVSAQTLLTRSAGHEEGLLPGVQDAARDISHLFGQAYGRSILPLMHGQVSGLEAVESEYKGEEGEGRKDELEELRELVGRAEEEARRLNEQAGGWRREPNVSSADL